MAEDIFYEKQEEILSGMMNAVNRGENIDVARVTFLNAGYDQQVVNAAANSLLAGQTGGAPRRTEAATVEIVPGKLSLRAQKAQPSVNKMQQERRTLMGIPYWLVILMILISMGIILAAGFLGLYWDQLFG